VVGDLWERYLKLIDNGTQDGSVPVPNDHDPRRPHREAPQVRTWHEQIHPAYFAMRILSLLISI
ncbi:hypothetical protein BUE80_DR003129, partial [Diplocarpon rosae]